jgi:Terminase RNaseH-like domain
MEDTSTSQLESTHRVVSFPRWEELLPHQALTLRSPQRFKVLVWHRRARKTTTALVEMVKQAHLRVGVYWHLFPTYTEAKDAVWRDPQMLFRIIPEELVAKYNQQELVVYFKNGSIMQLKGADDPDALRGPGPLGIVFDEFDTMKYEAWGVMEPVLRANGGWAWFIGTYKGKKNLYRLYQRGQGDNKEWYSSMLKASESGIIDQDQLAEAKAGMSEALYAQEFECDPLEGEGIVFRGTKEIATATPHTPLPEHVYVMGVDLAKYQDWTDISVFDRQTNAEVYHDRFQQIEWPFQKKRIKAVHDHYNHALVRLDATGVGDPIADDLARDGVSVDPFKITSQSKKELIEKLVISIEQKSIRILPVQQVIDEFESFSYGLSPTGQVTYQAPQGFHDDAVISKALAIYDLFPKYKVRTEPEKTPMQQAFEKQKEEFYGEVAELSEEWSHQ